MTNPEKSDGLSSEEARLEQCKGNEWKAWGQFRKRLLEGGANVLAPPKRISNLRLFGKQFLYKFWLLLMGEAGLVRAISTDHFVRSVSTPFS